MLHSVCRQRNATYRLNVGLNWFDLTEYNTIIFARQAHTISSQPQETKYDPSNNKSNAVGPLPARGCCACGWGKNANASTQKQNTNKRVRQQEKHHPTTAVTKSTRARTRFIALRHTHTYAQLNCTDSSPYCSTNALAGWITQLGATQKNTEQTKRRKHVVWSVCLSMCLDYIQQPSPSTTKLTSHRHGCPMLPVHLPTSLNPTRSCGYRCRILPQQLPVTLLPTPFSLLASATCPTPLTYGRNARAERAGWAHIHRSDDTYRSKRQSLAHY